MQLAAKKPELVEQCQSWLKVVSAGLQDKSRCWVTDCEQVELVPHHIVSPPIIHINIADIPVEVIDMKMQVQSIDFNEMVLLTHEMVAKESVRRNA